MSVSESGRLFSISDDGTLQITDLNEGRLVQEFNKTSNKIPNFKGQYVPVYNLSSREQGFVEPVSLSFSSIACPTSVSCSLNANTVVVGYSDDSFVMRDMRSKYSEVIRLEAGGHEGTVKCVAFGNQGADFLCLSGGSDSKLKLWDLRQKRCIGDYKSDDEFDKEFHTNSIWSICPTASFEACFTGGKDGSIYHTDLVGDTHTKLYQSNKNPIHSMCLDEEFMQLWFSSANDSSLKCLDLQKRSLDNKKAAKTSSTNIRQADYELEGLSWITDYHMLKNKRYIITNNSQNQPQVWNIDSCKLIKTYQSKTFQQVIQLMDNRYDLQPNQAPYP